MLLLLLFIILGLIIAVNTHKIHQINLNLVVLLFLIILLFVNFNMKEKFIDTNESTFLAIQGPSTINNLLNLQDKDIQHLENQYDIVKSLYQKKKDTLDKQKVKKLPFKNSCKVVSIAGSGQKDYSYDNSSRLVTNEGKFTRGELTDVLAQLNEAQNANKPVTP